MADLPACRLTETVPFTHYGGGGGGGTNLPVKQRRSKVKRYGAMFACMASRAVHIEATFSLYTDTFILALIQLIARHADVRSIYSDN